MYFLGVLRGTKYEMLCLLVSAKKLCGLKLNFRDQVTGSLITAMLVR